MNAKDTLLLSRCRIFRTVARNGLSDLLGGADSRIEAYDSGALVRTRGEPCNALLVLLEGKVCGEFQAYDGRVLRIETIAAPETIASAFLFASDARFPVNIIALEPVRICLIERVSLLGLAQASREILNALLEDIAERTELLTEKLRLTQFATLKQKVAGYLLERSERGSRPTVTLPTSQATIAELFGVARPSLGRVLHELEASGLISRAHRSIRICDPAALVELLRRSA